MRTSQFKYAVICKKKRSLEAVYTKYVTYNKQKTGNNQSTANSWNVQTPTRSWLTSAAQEKSPDAFNMQGMSHLSHLPLTQARHRSNFPASFQMLFAVINWFSSLFPTLVFPRKPEQDSSFLMQSYNSQLLF